MAVARGATFLQVAVQKALAAADGGCTLRYVLLVLLSC